MKRTAFRLLDLGVAIALSLAIANVAHVRDADPPRVRDSITLGGDPAFASDFSLAQIGTRRHRPAPQASATF